MAEAGRIPVPLRLCRGCRHFVRIENELCDFCGGDLAALEAAHAESVAEIRAVTAALRAAIAVRGVETGGVETGGVKTGGVAEVGGAAEAC